MNIVLPQWLRSMSTQSIFEMVLMSEQMPIPLTLCSHSSEDTSALEPTWSDCISLTETEIDRTGLEVVTGQLGSSGQVVLEAGRDQDRQWQAEYVMDAVVQGILKSLYGMTWEQASTISKLPHRSPALVRLLNYESLVHINPSIKVDHRGFVSDGCVVPVHEHLADCRELIPCLIEIAEDDHCSVFMAPSYWKSIDESEYVQMLLADHAYGRPFERDDLSDPHKTGVAVHTLPDVHTDAVTHWKCAIQDMLRVEFMWTSKQGKKTFHVEEIRSTDQWQYLHAIYDFQSQSFEHLDGAWKVFDPESAAARRDPNARFGRPKSQTKIKLFRVDGVFDVEVFSNLVSLFFRNNPLVHEYLAGHTGPSVSFRPNDQGDQPCNRA